MYPYRVFVEAGGLMSYGVDPREIGGRAADIADQILKGAKPGEISVFLAEALGLTVPTELLAFADEVIE
jgi:putative tryptophan/tyrosine transport system substrate-binding protein